MKTTALLIRVSICLLLSLIPVTELENSIYSARMDFRIHWKRPTQILLVEVESENWDNAETRRLIQEKVKAQSPSVVLINHTQHWNSILTDSDGVVRRAEFFARNQP